MVFNATDQQRLAIQIVEDAAEIAVELVAQIEVTQERAAFLGGKHNVKKDFCERLRHVGTVSRKCVALQPLSGLRGARRVTQGSSSDSQPVGCTIETLRVSALRKGGVMTSFMVRVHSRSFCMAPQICRKRCAP